MGVVERGFENQQPGFLRLPPGWISPSCVREKRSPLQGYCEASIRVQESRCLSTLSSYEVPDFPLSHYY